MNHLSLFSGIGGFDLAAHWAGWKNLAHCEIDPFCRSVIKKHFPDSESLTDIKSVDFSRFYGKIDVISGGFPCQPYSVAGLRKGSSDDRHLWPEMLRAIRQIKPRWVVGENVPGLINWGGGMVFEEVCAQLEHEGYEVLTFRIPAASVGATHLRERVWFIAYANGAGSQKPFQTELPGLSKATARSVWCTLDGIYTKAQRWIWGIAEPIICRAGYGIPYRVDRVKALGNAIVPQVAFNIFNAINQFEKIEK